MATDTSSSTDTTFTADDVAALAALQAKQAQVNWQAAEASRQTQLAAIQPAAEALGTLAALDATIAALNAARAGVDVDTAQVIGRILISLSIDVRGLLTKAAGLAVPIAQPTSTGATA